MGKRSKSFAIELSSKFEEPELDISDAYSGSDAESAEAQPIVTPPIEPDHISEQVIEKVLATLPKNDIVGYTKSLKKIKWNEIEIEGRTPKEIEKIFNHAIKDVNKVRTLTEILNAAKLRMNSFDKHPDHPKRPKTLFAMYVQERFKNIREENPEIESNEVMKKCSEEFKCLSEKKMQKLSARHAALLEDYNDKLTKYKLKHPDLIQKGKRSSESKLTNPFSFYWAERSEELGPGKDNYLKVRKEWQNMDVKKKAIYIKKFFESDPPEDKITKVDRKTYLEAKGAPVRPGTAFGVFMQEQQSDLTHLDAKERMKKVADKWAKLEKHVKEKYAKEANVEMELYKQKWQKFYKTLSKQEQKWVEPPKSSSGKRKKGSEEDETDTQENGATKNDKKQKKSNALPEPQKPPEDVINYFANKKFDGDRKAAKKKWKTLKESKKEKYQKQLEELQTTYFEELKTYLKSLSTEEVKEYKKRMKQDVKRENSSDDSD